MKLIFLLESIDNVCKNFNPIDQVIPERKTHSYINTNIRVE